MSAIPPHLEAAILRVGQAWVPTRATSRARTRHVVWATDAGHPSLRWIDGPTVGYRFDMDRPPAFPETGHDSWLSRQSFRDWIRKHSAVCKEPAGGNETDRGGL